MIAPAGNRETILLVHNHYQQSGGEDRVFASEAALLEARGHRVVRFTVHNDDVADRGPITLAAATIWNDRARREMRTLLERERPAVMHVHNTLPLLSPSIYYAARALHIPVVQTLHNYRLICPGALLFRNGQACHDCVGHVVPLAAVAHGCYRGSRAASAAVASMLATHNLAGTWRRAVDVYTTPTAFAREMFIAGGLSAGRIVVKPNFVDPDPGIGDHSGGFALFVGRLSPEKGLDVLLGAWESLDLPVPLRIIGDGPLGADARSRAGELRDVRCLGKLPSSDVTTALQAAKFLIFPSECYETFGLTVAEAFATGTPVICSDVGAAASLVADGVNGLHFRSGDADDLAAKVRWMDAHPTEVAAMGGRARASFERHLTADRNYQMLMNIYARAGASQPAASLDSGQERPLACGAAP